jgi:hypothetical protein
MRSKDGGHRPQRADDVASQLAEIATITSLTS